MGCGQAELHRLMDLIEYELFYKEPKPRSVAEVKARFERIAAHIRALSLDQLRSELGL
jgi:hypothetical protein